MPVFTTSHDQMGFVRIKDQPVRGTRTQQLTIAGGFADTAALAKIGGASWLSIPATCTNDTAFNVTILPANLPKESIRKLVRRTETIRVTKATFTTLDIVVEVVVKPGGPAP